jgi:hypothetical protein
VSDLHEGLDAALRTVIPHEAPVEAAMRQGRRLRTRRRIAAVTGVAALAVFAAVGYPALTRPAAGPGPAPVQHQPVMVTDMPPAPGSPDNGLIAMGTIGATRWQASISGSGSQEQCIVGQVGTHRMTGGCYQSGMLDEASSQSPLVLQGSSDGSYMVSVGGVAANVTYVVVTLADGQQLKLIPVTSHGHRYVGYVLPAGYRVARATAYLGGGQELVAVPFNPPGHAIPELVRWDPPGQTEPRASTVVVGSGTIDGQRWSVIAYVGPWGTCVGRGHGDGGSCWADNQMNSTGTIGYVGDTAQYVVGSADASVTEVGVALTDGTSTVVPVKAVGGERLWAFALAGGQHLKRWTAYDAAGRQVAAGTS